LNKGNPRGYPARQDWLWWAHTAIGHSPAMYLKAHGLGGQTSRICLVTAGINCIFVFGIKSQFDSKKSNERVCAHLSITPFIVYAERSRSMARGPRVSHHPRR
jgi:hypothetical protein